MVEKLDIIELKGLRPRYQAALVASGLVDDVADIVALDVRPCRLSEGDFVCRHGDAAESLWVIVLGSVAVREGDRTLFMRQHHEVVGEQNLLGNGCRRWYDLVACESQVELLEIDKVKIEQHPQADLLWRNIAKIISLKLKDASIKASTQSRQLEDDTRILQAYTNEYALGRRLQAGGRKLTDYKVERAIIWFSDVVDFSRHVVELAPNRTADIVQRFFNEQSSPIISNGGHIDKFMGDGLMAFWILPSDGSASEKCNDAVKAAEEAIKAVALIRIGNDSLHLRVGLHIGKVLSGDFGSTTRHQFTLIGPEVNKAARLEQVHEEDIIRGSGAIGAIRMSAEYRNELSDLISKRYSNKMMADAKNIGQIEFYC
ncbi:MAG: cyclic nucleotide-binding domain-containing protein [Rhizobiales bacterium]|nr:cyclic nucleotide-binding domain-containing protein [Hyphomicrobiales bacterium]